MYILKKEYNMNEQKEKKVIIILPPRENHLNILIYMLPGIFKLADLGQITQHP